VQAVDETLTDQASEGEGFLFGRQDGNAIEVRLVG
jgi:hypothetical protein